MFRYGIPIVLVLLLCAVLGAYAYSLPGNVHTILAGATEWHLYSLDPVTTIEKYGPGRAPDGFHGWMVLGSTTLPAGKERKKLLRDLGRAMNSKKPLGAKCFIPRHGIRAVYKGGVVGMVICFECEWVHVYIEPSGRKEMKNIQEIESTPQSAFNEALRAAGVQLPGSSPR